MYRAETSFALLAFSSLFAIINPISAAPIFVALTAGASAATRRKAAVKATITAALTLAVFAAAGGAIFGFFGITVPAFQIAGGFLFAAMSLRTLQHDESEIPENDRGRPDPSVVPIGIPLIAGPGAISTVMVLVGQAETAASRLALAGVIALNMAITLLILLLAPAIVARIGETGQRIVGKIMALISAVVGIQFMINGTTTVLVGILRSSRG